LHIGTLSSVLSVGRLGADAVCRLFKVLAKSDGRPAIEVDNGGKKQLFVSDIL
jgi:hypothetical protein